MPRSLSLALFLLLAISPALRADPETPAPASPKVSNQLLQQVFRKVLTPDQLGALKAPATPEQLVSVMTPEQKTAARKKLRELESQTQDPKQFSVIAKGYALLKAQDDALRVGGQMQELEPKQSQGFTIAASASLEKGQYEEAVRLSHEALARNPQDKEALFVLKTSEGRNSGGSGAAPISAPAGQSRPAAANQAKSGTSGQVIEANKESWTTADYQKANREAKGQNPIPGGRLDRDVPDLKGIASEVVANSPLGPLAPKPAGGPPFGTAAELALITSGGLLLFGGLGGKRLEEKLPGIRKGMGIAAAAGGVVAMAAMAAPRMLATAIPVASNPQTEEEASEVLPSGQPVIQRVAQSAPDITPQGEAIGEQVGSQVATQAGRLLNAQQAQIDLRKFTEYALNPDSPIGMHKARVFKSVLGYTRENYQSLIEQIRSGILSNPAIMGRANEYGARYTVDILVKGPAGQAVVRTGWIYSQGTEIPRLTSAYIKL